MTLSVIIATLSRPEDLTQCIDSILVQTLLPDQLIVVDAGHERELEMKIAHKLQKSEIEFKYVRSKPGLTRQRNLGVTFNHCDLVLFLDDDVVLDKEFIENIIEVFDADQAGQIGGVTGKILNQYELSFMSNLIRKIFFLPQVSDGKIKPSGANNSIESRIAVNLEVDWLAGCDMCFRSEVFSQWAFNEKIFMMEDVEFSCKVGTQYKLLYVPSAKIFHKVSPVSRLGIRQRRMQSICTQYGIFRDYVPHLAKNRLIFWWSIVGALVQALLLQRSLGVFGGAVKGIAFVILDKYPNTDC